MGFIFFGLPGDACKKNLIIFGFYFSDYRATLAKKNLNIFGVLFFGLLGDAFKKKPNYFWVLFFGISGDACKKTWIFLGFYFSGYRATLPKKPKYFWVFICLLIFYKEVVPLLVQHLWVEKILKALLVSVEACKCHVLSSPIRYARIGCWLTCAPLT